MNTPASIPTEYTIVFASLGGQRLHQVARFVAGLPSLAGTAFNQCDLSWSTKERVLVVGARFDSARAGAELLSRLRFWCTQLHASLFLVGPPASREKFQLAARLAACDTRARGISAADLSQTLERVVGAGLEGSDFRQANRGPMQLELPIQGGNALLGTSGVSMTGLFVTSPCAPPMGDRFALRLEVPSHPLPFEVDVRVAHVRAPAQARTGEPAGFALTFMNPSPELGAALGKWLQAEEAAAKARAARGRAGTPVGEQRRAHPRVDIHAPVSLEVKGPSLKLAYRDPARFVSDYVSNLSMGGAYVMTQSPPPLRSKVQLAIEALDEHFSVEGEVVHVAADGIGVQFKLDPTTEAKLASLVVRLSAPHRKVLLIEPEGERRLQLQVAFVKAGFRVLFAAEAAGAAKVLRDELVGLELVLCGIAQAEAVVAALQPALERAVLLVVRDGASAGRTVPGATAYLEAGQSSSGRTLATQALSLLISSKRRL